MSSRLRAFLGGVSAVFVPTLPSTLLLNRRGVKELPDGKDFAGHLAEWSGAFDELHPERREVATLLYEQRMGAVGGLEAKAVGVLQAVAIITAGGFVACTGSSVAIAFGSVSLVYASSAGIACGWAMIPRPRRVLTYLDLTTDSSGYAEMVAATRMIEPLHIRTANLVTSAVYDTVRALLAVVIAVALLIATR